MQQYKAVLYIAANIMSSAKTLVRFNEAVIGSL